MWLLRKYIEISWPSKGASVVDFDRRVAIIHNKTWEIRSGYSTFTTKENHYPFKKLSLKNCCFRFQHIFLIHTTRDPIYNGCRCDLQILHPYGIYKIHRVAPSKPGWQNASSFEANQFHHQPCVQVLDNCITSLWKGKKPVNLVSKKLIST